MSGLRSRPEPLKFVECTPRGFQRRLVPTRVVSVTTELSGREVGKIAWLARWGCYVLFTNRGALVGDGPAWSPEHLREIADTCQRMTRQHQADRRALGQQAS